MREPVRRGWYRRGDGPEKLFDGTAFTDQSRAPGERTRDGLPLFVWDEGGVIKDPSRPALAQVKEPGFRQVMLSRSARIGIIVGIVLVALFFVWVVLQNTAA